MGKTSKKYNWKSRQIVDTIIDDSEQKKIKVNLSDDKSHYDDANALALPSNKRETKKLRNKNATPVKLLSNKQRKRLTKIADKKINKEKRQDMLEELAKYQASMKDMPYLTSLQSVQTLGRKRFSQPVCNTLKTNRLSKVSKNNNIWDGIKQWKVPKHLRQPTNLSKNQRTYRVINNVPQLGPEPSSEDSEEELLTPVKDANVQASSCEKVLTAVKDVKVQESSSKEELLTTVKDTKVEESSSEKVLQTAKRKKAQESSRKEKRKFKSGKKSFRKEALLTTVKDIQVQESSSEEELLATVKFTKAQKSSSEKVLQTVVKGKEVQESFQEEKVKFKPAKKALLTTLKFSKAQKSSCEKVLQTAVKEIQESSQEEKRKFKPVKKSSCKKALPTTVKNTKVEESSTGEEEILTAVKDTIAQESSREKKRKFKSVIRDEKIQESRLKLPILSEEHTVMEAINENLVTIVVGSTGSGKTTQVPQFLYEAGYTKNEKLIGVTEPRRVAAIEMSERVGYELGLSKHVSYQVRFDGNSTPQTEIKFMTDGVLLKEILQDYKLTKYSVIIIDEAHERSLHSDILIGLLSRIVLQREKMKDPLKLVIMSATLRIEDFTENKSLFGEKIPPVVNIEGGNFTVWMYFNKVTDEDYWGAAYRKIRIIHEQKADNGAILVFLTGQGEIEKLCSKLREVFPMNSKKKLIKTNEISKKRKKNWMESNVNKKYKKEDENNRKKYRKEDEIKDKFNKRNHRKGRNRYFNGRRNNESKSVLFSSDDENDVSHVKDVDIYGVANSYSVVPIPNKQKEDVSDAELSEYDSDQEIVCIDSEREKKKPLWVLPLYSALERPKQKLVFKKPPEGTRLCVVATNVAETSLTIPNVKYVVDCGKVKEKVYDQITGVSSFKIDWTSKASADQRAGRAGRTCDGFCYRLYSSAVFNDEFAQYSTPDIEKRPLDEVVLLLKKLKIPVYKFPYPTPPIPSNIDRSIKRLVVLGALEYETDAKSQQARNATSREDNVKITGLGNILSLFPVSPRFAKILRCAAKYDIFNRWNEPILEYVIIIVAVLSVKQLLLDTAYEDNVKSKWEQHRARWSSGKAWNYLGDILVMLNAVIEAESTNTHVSVDWCRERGIGYLALMEVKQLRRQLTKEIRKLSLNDLRVKIDLPLIYFKLDFTPRLPEPSPAQCKAIAEMMLFGSLDQVAKKLDLSEKLAMNDQGYLISQLEDSYRISNSEKLCYIDKTSIFQRHKANYPQWLIYQDIYEPKETNYQRNDRVYLKGISVISEEWLLEHGGELVELGPPLDDPVPRYCRKKDRVMCYRKGSFGPNKWPLDKFEVEFPLSKDLFKWVAYFLLIGELIPSLAKYRKTLYDPKTLLNPFSLRYKNKIKFLIECLMSEEKKITCLKALKDVWKKQPNFLKKEYLSWVNSEESAEEIEKNWPPIKCGDNILWC